MKPPIPPPFPPHSPAIHPDEELAPVVSLSKVALWRWWVATILIGSGPVLSSIAGQGNRGDQPMVLPKSVLHLLFFAVIEFALFGLLWGVAWLFARATKDDLLLRLRNGWKAIGWGIGYSIAMRVGLLIVMICGLTLLSLFGLDVAKMVKLAEENGQGAQKVFGPAMANSSLLYKVVMVTVISFVVAGLREELWRTFTMAGLQRIFPRGWSLRAKNVVAVLLSSFLFGLGHIYQGATGVLQTMVLGAMLGAIVLHHKSIWPAVVAHGCINAVSFIALALIKPGG